MALRYPSDGYSGEADYVCFSKMQYNGRSKTGGGGGGGYITLYMPETTPTINNNNMWGRESMGGPGPLGLAKRKLGETILGDLNKADIGKLHTEEEMQPFIDNIKDMVGDLKGLAKPALVQMGTQLAGEALGMSANSILQQKTGQIYNPNVELIYQGPGFREFGFSFNLIPKSSGDAQMISQIIREFKKWSAPSTQGAGDGMYKIPYVWQVSYKGPCASFMNKFKPAALTTVSVTDNDGIAYYGAHKDGAPLQTTLSLQFKEVDMVLREDHTGTRGF